VRGGAVQVRGGGARRSEPGDQSSWKRSSSGISGH
jgi:hypothetical protein